MSNLFTALAILIWMGLGATIGIAAMAFCIVGKDDEPSAYAPHAELLGEIAKENGDLRVENAKLRELVWDMYCLAYPSAVEREVSDEAYDKYSPCEKCNELHGGKSPCASTAKDMTEECCEPIQAAVVADRMRELGIEVDA